MSSPWPIGFILTLTGTSVIGMVHLTPWLSSLLLVGLENHQIITIPRWVITIETAASLRSFLGHDTCAD